MVKPTLPSLTMVKPTQDMYRFGVYFSQHSADRGAPNIGNQPAMCRWCSGVQSRPCGRNSFAIHALVALVTTDGQELTPQIMGIKHPPRVQGHPCSRAADQGITTVNSQGFIFIYFWGSKNHTSECLLRSISLVNTWHTLQRSAKHSKFWGNSRHGEGYHTGDLRAYCRSKDFYLLLVLGSALAAEMWEAVLLRMLLPSVSSSSLPSPLLFLSPPLPSSCPLHTPCAGQAARKRSWYNKMLGQLYRTARFFSAFVVLRRFTPAEVFSHPRYCMTRQLRFSTGQNICTEKLCTTAFIQSSFLHVNL